MATKYPIVVSQRVPFSVLFPGVAEYIEIELMLHFKLLQCSFLSALLSHCTEKLTHDLIVLPEKVNGVTHNLLPNKPKSTIPYFVLDGEELTMQKKIKNFVTSWHNFVTAFCDEHIARIAYPCLFEFVRNQVLCREQTPCILEEQDLAQIVMLMVKETSVLYKGNRWGSNSIHAAKTFGRWFSKE